MMARLVNLGSALRRIGVWCTLPIAVAGCAGSHSHGGARESQLEVRKGLKSLIERRAPGKYTPDGSTTLVREAIAGGYVAITGRRYLNHGRIYLTLAGRIEPLNERIASSGGLPLDEGGSGALDMAVYRSCAGSHAYALAYGLLRQPKDAVTAQADAHMIAFKKVAIPASFGAEGVVVYALLGGGTTNIVTRTPSGQIVGNVSYTGREAGTSGCHGS
jgi:hypothetical protein